MEFCSRSQLIAPKSFGEVVERVKANRQFSGDYAAMTGVIISLWVVTHPVTLIIVVSVASAWTYLLKRTEPVVVGGRELTERQAYMGMAVLTGMLFFMTSVLETILYGLSVALFLCLMHAVMHTGSSASEAQYGELSTTGDLELGSLVEDKVMDMIGAEVAKAAAGSAAATPTQPAGSLL